MFAKPRTKTKTESCFFSRQNDAGLRVLNAFLRGNLELVVILFLKSKALYCKLLGLPATVQASRGFFHSSVTVIVREVTGEY